MPRRQSPPPPPLSWPTPSHYTNPRRPSLYAKCGLQDPRDIAHVYSQQQRHRDVSLPRWGTKEWPKATREEMVVSRMGEGRFDQPRGRAPKEQKAKMSANFNDSRFGGIGEWQYY